MASGQVYLQVIECKDLWDETANKKDKTPYVTLKVPDDKLKEFRKTKTKLYKDTTSSSPQFNEQFVFAIPSKNHPVTLKVANEKLGANEELGEAILELGAVPDGAPVHLWVPVKRDMKGVKGAPTNGQVHVLAIFTPQPVAEKFSRRPIQRLPLFRLGLERQHYFAGEKMRGLVFLNVGKPFEARGVRLFFEGIQHVYWTEQHSNGKHTYTVTYSKTVTIFSSMTTVFGIPQVDMKKKDKTTILVGSGQYAFPFEFTFPVNIPPTMQIDASWTRYRVRGKIDRPKGKSKWIEAPVNIYIEYGSLKETSDIAQKVKKYGKQPIIVTAHSSKEILYLNENAAFHVNIKNESEKKVTNLKVTLMKHYTLISTAKARAWKVHHLRTVIKDETIFPVLPGSERQLTVNLLIPDGLQPSLPNDISPIIHINYIVKIAADVSGAFSGKVRAYIPVKIGWRHPPQLAGIPLPLAPMGNPGEIRLMPQFSPPPMAITLPQELQTEMTEAQLSYMQQNIQQYFVGQQGQAMPQNYLPAMPEGYEEGENTANEEWSAWRQSQRVILPQGYTPVGPVSQGQQQAPMTPPMQHQGSFNQPPPNAGGYQQPPPQFQGPQGQMPPPQNGGGYQPPPGYGPPPTQQQPMSPFQQGQANMPPPQQNSPYIGPSSPQPPMNPPGNAPLPTGYGQPGYGSQPMGYGAPPPQQYNTNPQQNQGYQPSSSGAPLNQPPPQGYGYTPMQHPSDPYGTQPPQPNSPQPERAASVPPPRPNQGPSQ